MSESIELPNGSMRLAILSSSYPFGNGETFLSDFFDAPRDSTHEIVLVTMWRRGKARYNGDVKGIEHYILNRFRINPLVVILHFLQTSRESNRPLAITRLQWLYRILRESVAFAMGSQLGKLLRKRNVDHIHANWASGTSTAAQRAAAISEIKWSFSGHSGDLIEAVNLKKKIENAAGIRLISQQGMNFLLQNELSVAKAKIIHLGVKPRNFDIPGHQFESHEIRIACVGNLLPIKGHKFLISAVSAASLQGKNIYVDLIGSGPELNNLKKVVNSTNLEKKIRFIPAVNRNEILKRYSNGHYDLVILASIKSSTGQAEGIPVSLMEAMSFGIPVIATRLGGVPELLSEFPNLMVEPGDTNSLRDAIVAISEFPPEERESLSGRLKYKVLTEFNSEIQGQALKDWLRQIA